MKLEIVWRNPERQINTKQTVQRVGGDQSCAVYAVIDADGKHEFSLIAGNVA